MVDLNFKHVTWNFKTTNPNGRILYKFISNTLTIKSAPDTLLTTHMTKKGR